MEINITLLSLFAVLLVFIVFNLLKRKKIQPVPAQLHESYRAILSEEVPFYQQLNADQKASFEKRLLQFLAAIQITGVKTVVEDIDRVLIAASAIIPIFNFPHWQYANLHEVLLYPDSFAHDFAQQGQDRNVLGMVGSGALNNVMILSQFELRQSFSNKTGKSNTAIHEFVHLVDKTDGQIDGLPDAILDKQYILPWLHLMEKEIEAIRHNESDINPYGSTNESEFFAVVAEYFFERPELLQQKHPELYAMLERIFGGK